jgi:curved DNA-binding protein CbpA
VGYCKISSKRESNRLMNHYVVLGVDEDADRETIRSAFRGLVRRYHPDAGAGSSPDTFLRVVEAYETLIDPQRRRVYDRALHPNRAPAPPTVRPVVEPLGNRVMAERIASGRFPATTHRRPIDFVQVQIDVVELFDALFRSIDAGWSARRPRNF